MRSTDPNTKPGASAATPAVSERTTTQKLVAATPFIAVHVAALIAMIALGAPALAWAVCGVSFLVMMFGITAGYHRYFSHRTFKTSRAGQLALAFIAQSSAQKGVLWWAAHHRDHHKHSDTERDVHSPVQRGFWYAQVGWLFDGTDKTKLNKVRDLARYPELRFLNRYPLLPPIVTGALLWLTLGFTAAVGFVAAIVFAWHATGAINSLAHVIGHRTYETSDDSRNNLLLALLTLGEGWHNNHHHHMLSTRQGFRWWEIDITYYVLRLLAMLRLVWDLREPPPEVVLDTIARRQDEHRAHADAVPMAVID